MGEQSNHPGALVATTSLPATSPFFYLSFHPSLFILVSSKEGENPEASEATIGISAGLAFLPSLPPHLLFSSSILPLICFLCYVSLWPIQGRTKPYCHSASTSSSFDSMNLILKKRFSQSKYTICTYICTKLNFRLSIKKSWITCHSTQRITNSLRHYAS